MVRIVHMSDLHFGRDRPELHATMLEVVNGLAPDLVVVSGDFTQRAKENEFRAARDFTRRLHSPVMGVPGNHDVPLYNFPARLLSPWWGYRRNIDEELEPVFASEAMVVAGINTTDPLSWQRGRVRERSIDLACARFRAAPEGALKVLVAHHPFEQAVDAEKTPTKGAAEALRKLRGCGLDIVLSGHLHQWAVAPYTRLAGGAGAIQIQAGTGLSTRQRGEENDFNLITREGQGLAVTRYIAGEDGSFTALPLLQLHRADAGWHRDEAL